MAVFRLSLLLHVGFVIGSNRLYADRSVGASAPAAAAAAAAGKEEEVGAIPGAPLAHLRAPRLVPGEKSEEHLPRVVTAFLHTGDSTTLKHANCSRKYELTSLLRGRSHETPHRSMSGVLETVLHATNFLNTILQANRSREHNLRRDIEWYHALVRSILEGDAKIHRAVVTFGGDASFSGPQVLLQATRAGGEIVLQDLSRTAHRRLHNRTADTEWYHGMKEKKEPRFHRRVLSKSGRSAGEGAPERAESFIPDRTHVRWSAPYLECENGNFVPRWLLTLSAAFYGLKSNLHPEFRGVVRVDVNLQDVDIDQCSTNGWFAGTHRCNLTTMECLPLHGHGFVLDKYQCQCRKGFYHPNRVAVNGFTKAGRKGKAGDGGPGEDEGSPSDCLPCQQGCAFCKDNSPCVALEDGALRLAVLCFQCLCMLIAFISMVLIYHFRRNKSIRASGLVLLEAILCGALLLYFPVGILYFHPSVFRCILLRWVRLLGFATVYGTLTLKLYRVLKVFLSRTAQRIPYMTSWRVLRLLAIILLIVCWFLVAWTSAVCQNPDRKLALIDVGYTPDGSQFGMCLLDRWDYMMAVAEFLFLLWGVYLCYAVRTVPSAFHEPRYMAIALHNELVLSAVFHVIRFTLAHELHPDWTLLLFFTHTHLTVTVTLGLLLVPKFLFAGTQMRDDIASEAYEDELDMGRSGSYLNSSITSAWSEHSLDPEDIRTPEEMGHLSSINGCGVRSCDSLWEKRTNEELKKLYSQLEIYKRKKMLANNPHLQKKRSSKKGLGRSLMRRITEIPESVHRQCSREEKEVGDHGSNRNSICMLKKNPLEPSHQVKPAKEETLKHKVFSLKKSHSSYDHVRDQNDDASRAEKEQTEMATTEGSLLDTLMGKKLVKKTSSENMSAPSESTESVPLVCKSASAHNLTADKKPIHPRASMLQKSLSVIASAKEKTLGLTGKTQSSEDSNKKTQPKSKDTKANAETENDCQPKSIIGQSTEYKPSTAKGRIMKQPVTSSQPTVCSDPVRGKDLYDVSEVCPWELEDLPTPSENKIQKHVSIAPKETTTIHGGSTKGSKSHKQKVSDQSPSSGRHSKESHKTTAVRAEVCPWEDGGEKQASLSEGSRQPVSSQSRSGRPHSAAESSKTKRPDICPWDFEEQQKPTELAKSPDTIKQKKLSSPVDGRGRTPISDTSKGVASLHLPTTKAEICPWDYDSTAISPNTDRTPSPAQPPNAKESPSIKKGTPFTRTAEKEKSKDAEDEKSLTKGQDMNKSSDKRLSQQKLSEVCPWDVESPQEVLQVEKRKSANVGAAKQKQAEVCPWDFELMSSKTSTDKSAPVEKQSSPNSKGAAASSAKTADVCPWDFDESKTA
ncbi:probable G-protein coupled receptor 158 isoform X1 [Fundulus heteroclitus]|uniref:probable G-protein coupled receptor 158 isoform X1 n=1 Tax=Fundulus heteroclitus TaxID=8078 RepID=UPI00165CA241|nr:probable G-protein coupled receptor 158 isoform X1 [Fundulus heteroclitus]